MKYLVDDNEDRVFRSGFQKRGFQAISIRRKPLKIRVYLEGRIRINNIYVVLIDRPGFGQIKALRAADHRAAAECADELAFDGVEKEFVTGRVVYDEVDLNPCSS